MFFIKSKYDKNRFKQLVNEMSLQYAGSWRENFSAKVGFIFVIKKKQYMKWIIF